MDKKTIVVCGATGNQGGAVVQSLISEQTWNVVALSRSPDNDRTAALKTQGVQVVGADLQDKPSLFRAFKDAYGVFGVTQPWSPDYKKCNAAAEVEQGRNIVDACLHAGVKHLVLSTVFHFDRAKTGIPHVDSKLTIEEYTAITGVPSTVLRPGSFMENIGRDYFPIKKGSVKGYVDGDAKVPYVACRDIGKIAVVIFANPPEYLGKQIDVIGDLVSGDDLCQILIRLRNGERFKYKTIPRLLMRLFAKEFYGMRVAFEKYGHEPYPQAILDAIDNCRRIDPQMMTVESYLKSKGYDDRVL